ncbi:MAG: hypothetical protein LBE76_08245 [Nitrososphaerota archaeon]|jgi:hypothetical protein|nr:hypothetical protein [Nitrososphaerota archaeon]
MDKKRAMVWASSLMGGGAALIVGTIINVSMFVLLIDLSVLWDVWALIVILELIGIFMIIAGTRILKRHAIHIF